MNYYGFAHPLRAFLAEQDVNYHRVRIDADELDRWLTDARSSIPYANQLCQLNLLGSHDTTRFATLLGEDPGLLGMALVMQFSYPGVPCLYYGDEIGMTGANDPYNRACFDWNEEHWDTGLQSLVRRLARLRQAHRALRHGAYQTMIARGDIFGFARFDETDQFIVLVNRGAEPVPDVAVPLHKLPELASSQPLFQDLLHNCFHQADRDELRINLAAKTVMLLRRAGA